MIKTAYTELNKTKFITLLFIMSCVTAVIASLFLDKSKLVYFVPPVILIILIIYLRKTKSKISPFFVFGMSLIFITDILIFQDFEKHFVWIASFTALNLLSFTYVLKKYLIKSVLKSIMSIPVLIAALLVVYVSYAVINLLSSSIPSEMISYTIIAFVSLGVFSGILALIYINDRYVNGVILLASGVFNIFQMALSPINEFFYYNRTFTVLIVICHILWVYLFMKFIVEAQVYNIKRPL